MSTPEETKAPVMTEQEQKELKRLKTGYTVQQMGGGVEKAYISTYSSYLYTNVYMMPAAFSGLITIVQSIVGWIGAPVFGGLIDQVKFKNAKYYPWQIIGCVVYYGAWILIYCLPVFGLTGYKGAVCALICAIISAIASPLFTVSGSAIYPNISANPADRQFLARMQKLGRDGGKTIFGYIFPVILPAFALAFSQGASEATARGEAWSYAICSLIACLPAIFGTLFYALRVKGSYIERNALAKSANAAKKGVPLSAMIKGIFGNRPLLGVFLFMALHKSYYFIYTGCAVYMFRYIFGDFSKMKFFMTIFNLTAIIGVACGGFWKKIFKETKRCFVTNMIAHVAMLAVIAFTFNKGANLTLFLIEFGISSFFMGMLENYMLPMFAASSDYGEWKTHERQDGLTMSCYSLTVKTGTLVSTTLRTAVLVAAGLDAITAGGAVTDHFINTMSTFWTMAPLGIGILSLLSLMFIFNLNDQRIADINADLKAGVYYEDSTHKF